MRIPSNKTLSSLILTCGIAFCCAPLALGSGSASGGGGVSQFGQLYIQGKVVFFRKIACDRENCHMKRNDLNARLASELLASIRSRDELKLEENRTDKMISGLSSDELEQVEHYLVRRFRL